MLFDVVFAVELVTGPTKSNGLSGFSPCVLGLRYGVVAKLLSNCFNF